MLKWLVLFMGMSTAACADPTACPTCTYLISPDQPTALARSQQQCQALACDGVLTKYWWNVIGPLNAGLAGATPVPLNGYAVEIQATGPFAATATVSKNTAGLTAMEQSAVATAAQIAPLVPVVVTPIVVDKP